MAAASRRTARVRPTTGSWRAWSCGGRIADCPVDADGIDWTQKVGVLWFFDGGYYTGSQSRVMRPAGAGMLAMAREARRRDVVCVTVGVRLLRRCRADRQGDHGSQADLMDEPARPSSSSAGQHFHAADVDPHFGYRSYAPGQVRTATRLRVLRTAGLSLEDVEAALADPDRLPALLEEHGAALRRRRDLQDRAMALAHVFTASPDDDGPLPHPAMMELMEACDDAFTATGLRQILVDPMAGRIELA